MFKLSSENELLDCFRPMDREEVILSESLQFPLMVRDYVSWIEPAGNRVYVVFSDGQSTSPLGIVFRRDQGSGEVALMCDWCHSVRGSGEVGLLTAKSSSKRTVGMHLCRDLSCKEKIKAPPGASDFPALKNEQERIKQLILKMSDLARRQLF